jgi:predicted phage gp36 major capsid-like protein
MANEVFLHKRVVQVFRMGTDELSVAVASADAGLSLVESVTALPTTSTPSNIKNAQDTALWSAFAEMANEVFLHKRVVQVFRMGTDELSVAVASADAGEVLVESVTALPTTSTPSNIKNAQDTALWSAFAETELERHGERGLPSQARRSGV